MKSRDFSNIELAERSGVEASLISRYLAAERKPGADKALALAMALAITVDQLMGADAAPAEPFVAPTGGRQSIEAVIAALGDELADLAPEPASLVLERLRAEHFKGSPSLPAEYWSGRLRRLIAEELGRSKSVHQREAAEAVDLTQESPEVQRGRRKPKRL